MTISDKKLSNPSISCVNSDLTQNRPTCSIAPIHADEITMNANSRSQRRRFDSYPLRQLECGVRNLECEIQICAEPGHSAFPLPPSALSLYSRAKILGHGRYPSPALRAPAPLGGERDGVRGASGGNLQRVPKLVLNNTERRWSAWRAKSS